ncbi:hypothetical protein P280DRAFT_467524 [Massarina eburnea CBS 473.64]|uniref:Uncharacterized protein n=1 Tax=Massarina eburnea CBS 473.64 TaxID=1395130 RepID=A0A6A6S8E6_9PLEO|nr:hypothetical protein P280DRAFT_467524 [Massarina eburnea CBS 473.64]
MTSISNLSWVPPANNVSSLQFDNCDIPSEWLSNYFRARHEWPMNATKNMLLAGYHQYWMDSKITPPTPGEVMNWFFNTTLTNDDDSVVKALTKYTNTQCLDKFCSLLPWQGNADFAGRGMLATYATEAVFVTFYVVVLLTAKAHRSKTTGKAGFGRIHEATRESLRAFLDAALLFAIAMLVAAVYNFGITLYDSDKAVTFISSIMSAFVSLFSILPAIALHSSASSNLRRSKTRIWIWLLIGSLTIAMMGLGLFTYGSIRSRYKKVVQLDSSGQLLFEETCLDVDALGMFTGLLVCLFVILAAFVLIYVIFVCVWTQQSKKTGCFAKFRTVWTAFAAFGSMVLMWVAFGVFCYYRSHMDSRAGDSNQDHEWSFGQILALFTFVPVVIEWVTIWWEGAEDGLNGLMSDQYKVYRNDAVSQVEVEEVHEFKA